MTAAATAVLSSVTTDNTGGGRERESTWESVAGWKPIKGAAAWVHSLHMVGDAAARPSTAVTSRSCNSWGCDNSVKN